MVPATAEEMLDNPAGPFKGWVLEGKPALLVTKCRIKHMVLSLHCTMSLHISVILKNYC